MLAPGHLIGDRYRLLSVIGKGGMGVVWAAKNEAIDRDVAIKVMLPEMAADPDAFSRFIKEARICGSIRHPGIVDVLDLGKAQDGAPFIVMELLHGTSLDAMLPLVTRLGPAAILPLVRDVARTLALAHAKGIVHRDLKPANLFLHRMPTGDAIVKVLDFGVSKILSATNATKVTQTGAVLGSPAYMSPEQADGRKQIDHRTDVHALGLVLYEALSGGLPFELDNYNALVVDLATKDPPSLQQRAPQVPKPVAELVHACVERDRERRIQSAAELADRIDAVVAKLAIECMPLRALLDASEAPVYAGAGALAAPPHGGGAFSSSVYSRTVVGRTGPGDVEASAVKRRWPSRLLFGVVALAGAAAIVALLLGRRAATTNAGAPPEGTIAPDAVASGAPSVLALPATPTPPVEGTPPSASARPPPSPPPSASTPPRGPIQPGGRPVAPRKNGAWDYD